MALIDNLISHWTFDESSGNATDSHGSNNLTNVASVTYTSGKINNCADLERSSSQYFEITDASQSGLDISNDMSVSFWMNAETMIGTIFNKYAATGNQRSYQFNLNSGTWEFVVSGNGSSTAQTTGLTHSMSTGSWYFIVVTYDASAGDVVVYQNGTILDSETITATNPYNGTAPFRIGNQHTTNYYDGLLDEVSIWSRVLDSTEVSDLYNGGFGLSYPFDITTPSGFFAFF